MSHPTRAVTRPGGRRVADGDTGFTLVELAVSMGIMAVAVGALVEMLGSGQSGFRTQLAAADVQQRMRAAATLISGDLLMAGGGPGRAGVDGALGRAFPALRPARRGLRAPDGELAFARDRISIVYATHARSQTTLSAAMGSTGSDVPIHAGGPGCPLPACGFLPGMRALIFDAGGAGLGYDLFTVDRVGPATLGHPPFSRAYGQAAPPVAPAPIVPAVPPIYVSEVVHRVYYHDAESRRLMRYDGHRFEAVVADDVVGLDFAYYADPAPTAVPPPAPGGRSCLYDPGVPPTPRLTDLGGTTLTRLEAAQLTDGPVCGVAPNRFDGDLLRIRKVRVTIRVQASQDSLRGRDPRRFARAGLSSGGARYVPDYTLTFEVTPRNLNLGR